MSFFSILFNTEKEENNALTKEQKQIEKKLEGLMMGKELSEMKLEELWDLFPIFLVQHDDQWNGYYEEIEAVITDLLKDYQIKRISRSHFRAEWIYQNVR